MPVNFGGHIGRSRWGGLSLALGAGGRVPGLPLPEGFTFPAAYTPTIRSDGSGGYTASINERGFVDSRVWTGPAYHVDPVNGNNANTGLGSADGDFTNAVKYISDAITKGNATGAPYRVICQPGTYTLTEGVTSSTTGVRATQDLALIAWGGRALHHSALTNLTWTLDTGTTWKASRNQVGFVLDLLNTNADGTNVELVSVADVATCNATPGSWTEVSNVVYVNRADGAQVTNANTRALLWVTAATFSATSKSVYVEGFDFQGGRYGALDFSDLTTVATGNVVAVDCTFRYAGRPSSRAPGFFADRKVGLALLVRCTAEKNSTDGLNFHANSTGAALYVVSIDCIGRANGRYGETSANGWTSHETVTAIDVNGQYSDNGPGADVHSIQSTKTWFVGTQATATSTGGADPTAFKVTSPSTAWLQGTTAESPGKALYAQTSGATIYKRDHTTVSGTETANVGATITTF